MIDFWENMTPVIRTIYGVILIYFTLGALGFYVINKNKPPETAKKSYIKFFTYFLIINFLFWFIVLAPAYFRYVVVLIVIVGFLELTHLFIRSGYRYPPFYMLSITVFVLLSIGFYQYSLLPYQSMLYAFIIISIFDSFSQITGQLWGKRKIVPSISPNKTFGGVIGGIVVAVFSAFLLTNLYTEMSFGIRLFFIGGIIASAFIGDILASLYKRKFSVKDYNRLIPGHGGFLDRFDSLIAGGAWVALFQWLQ